MTPFTRLTASAAVLSETDVDTDVIFPARFLLLTAKAGLGRYAFYERRYTAAGEPKPDFFLNQPRFADAQILVAGCNFGCGSSREQAPWALQDLGFRCIIAPSFSEIFFSNCFRNGILPLVLPGAQCDACRAEAEGGRPITVDLESQQILLAGGEAVDFQVDPWRRTALLNGWDEVAVILNLNGAAIDRFEAAQRTHSGWLYAAEQ